MGWWGHDILSGDPPLDILGFIEEELGVGPVELYPDGAVDDPQTRSAVAGRLGQLSLHGWVRLARSVSGWRDDDALRQAAARTGGGDDLVAQLAADRDDDVRLAWQVLAVLSMACGVAVPDPVRALMVDAGQHDRWAADDPARAAAVDRLLATLRDYDATPTPLASATLGDAVVRSRQVGHQGLLNVFPPDGR